MAAVLALGAGCGVSDLERGFALTLPHDLHAGARGLFGMPRSPRGLWLTQLVLRADVDGFFAAAGGVSVRRRAGVTPRAGAAFGVGGRSFTGDAEGRNIVGPYGEVLVGVDVPLAPGRHDAARLTTQLGASAYLNGDRWEPHLFLAVGLLWN